MKFTRAVNIFRGVSALHSLPRSEHCILFREALLVARWTASDRCPTSKAREFLFPTWRNVSIPLDGNEVRDPKFPTVSFLRLWTKETDWVLLWLGGVSEATTRNWHLLENLLLGFQCQQVHCWAQAVPQTSCVSAHCCCLLPYLSSPFQSSLSLLALFCTILELPAYQLHSSF